MSNSDTFWAIVLVVVAIGFIAFVLWPATPGAHREEALTSANLNDGFYYLGSSGIRPGWWFQYPIRYYDSENPWCKLKEDSYLWYNPNTQEHRLVGNTTPVCG